MQSTAAPLLEPTTSSRRSWPLWAQVLASMALCFHMSAILSAALAARPSSSVQQRIARYFVRYNDLVNQGYGYRFYAKLDTTADPAHPRPWGTPVVTAVMEFAAADGGKTTETVRLPQRGRLWPRLRHQRQLDLAYHLSADPRWAASYARELCKTRGCQMVSISTQEHHIPDLPAARAAAERGDWRSIDLDAATTYTPSVKLGDFSCDDF